jgi:hypothetical protein
MTLGPPESATSHPENQEGDPRKRLARRPGPRLCLLKGCEQALSATTGAATLLQRAVPEGGAGLVAEEGAGELPDHGGRQTKA